MGGWSLAESAERLYPDQKILFMSGYPSTMIASHGVLEPGKSFLEKPFSLGVLKAKVLEMLRSRGDHLPSRIERFDEQS